MIVLKRKKNEIRDRERVCICEREREKKCVYEIKEGGRERQRETERDIKNRKGKVKDRKRTTIIGNKSSP